MAPVPGTRYLVPVPGTLVPVPGVPVVKIKWLLVEKKHAVHVYSYRGAGSSAASHQPPPLYWIILRQQS